MIVMQLYKLLDKTCIHSLSCLMFNAMFNIPKKKRYQPIFSSAYSFFHSYIYHNVNLKLGWEIYACDTQ